MEITSSSYRVWFDEASGTVHLEGSMRLGTAEYEPIWVLLQKVIEREPPVLTLHVRELEFLNSSGINTLYKFAVALRTRARSSLLVKASQSSSWQSKSLANLKRFFPGAELRVS